LTIEHVMPQAWAAHWPLDRSASINPETGLADPITEQKAQQRRDRLVNTLGNLTLITGSLNPSLSNSAWCDKRPELIKFSKLNLTQYFHGNEAVDWNEAAIERRTSYLCGQLTRIWPALPQAGAAPLPPLQAPATSRALAQEGRIDRATLPGLSNYTGNPPNEFAKRVIKTLSAHGFTVAPTDQGPNDQRKTLRISWRGVFIGLMTEALWGRKVPYACLYRFAKSTSPYSIAKAPKGFDMCEFARQHGCDPNLLHVHTDYSGSYLWVQDETTTLRLMQDWARRIDDISAS
jgi:hypothetical protein